MVDNKIGVLREEEVDKFIRIIWAQLKENAKNYRLEAMSTQKINESLSQNIDELEEELNIMRKKDVALRTFFSHRLRDMSSKIEDLEEENLLLRAKLSKKRKGQGRFSTI